MLPILEKKTATSNTILAVGSVAFDSIKTPAGKADRILGGSANYFSLSASFFTNLNLVGVVGNDFPKSHVAELNKRGVDTAGLEVANGETFHWVGEYGDDLNAKTLSTFLNVFEHFNPKLPEKYKDSKYIFLANIDPDLQRSVYGQIKKPTLVAADTMNFWIGGKRDSLIQTLKIVDLMTINEGEAFMLTEKKNIVDAAKEILKMGPKALIVKRGEYGALVFTQNDGIFSAPALPLSTVKDPTGAGDTFAGGMMGYIAHEDAGADIFKDDRVLRRAVIFGCVMASFTVEDFGPTRLMQITPKMIQDRYQQFLNMTMF